MALVMSRPCTVQEAMVSRSFRLEEYLAKGESLDEGYNTTSQIVNFVRWSIKIGFAMNLDDFLWNI